MSLLKRSDIDSVVLLMAAAAALLALVAAGASLASPATRPVERPFEVPTPQAALLSHDPLGSPMGETSEP